jgi:hypothetical protein
MRGGTRASEHRQHSMWESPPDIGLAGHDSKSSSDVALKACPRTDRDPQDQ